MPLLDSGFKVSGLDTAVKDLEDLGVDVGKASLAGIDKSGHLLEKAILANYYTMFHRKYATGALEKSISHTAKLVAGTRAVGTAGVFKIDRVMTDHGHDEKHAISRPQLAYWYETGIQAHSTRPKDKVASGKQTGKLTSPISPKPFITAAYDANVENIITEMSTAYNEYAISKGF